MFVWSSVVASCCRGSHNSGIRALSIMPPTQASRLEELEEVVVSLQGDIPELRDSMEEKLKELKKFFEDSQSKAMAEQNKKMEESAKEQRNITTVLSTLTAEVKTMNARWEEKNGGPTPDSYRERSEVEQNQQKNGEVFTYMEEFRQSVEKNSEKTQSTVRKLDFPFFFGEDPDGWVNKVERYFDVYQLSEKEKMGAASLGLEGDALAWFQWENKRRAITNWRTLRRMLLKHFRGRRGGSLMEQWMSIRQEGVVEDFMKVFIQFAANLEEEVSESCLLANFMKGLEWRIQAELRLMDPGTMEEAIDWAVKIEEKLWALGLLNNYSGAGRQLQN